MEVYTIPDAFMRAVGALQIAFRSLPLLWSQFSLLHAKFYSILNDARNRTDSI
jgi:hypothetical protein